MKFILLIFVLLIDLKVYSQISLSDSLFINSFKSTLYDLKDIKSPKSKKWQLIGGNCHIRNKNHTLKEDSIFTKYLDSLRWNQMKNIRRRLNHCYEQSDSLYDDCERRNIDDSVRVFKLKCDSITNSYRDLCSDNENYEYKILHDKLDSISDNYYHSYFYFVEFSFKSHDYDIFKSIHDSSFLCKKKGIGTFCPPSWCNWFILSEKNNKVAVIENFDQIVDFVGKIDNPSKACLLIYAAGLNSSMGIPYNPFSLRYKRIKKDYYFIMDLFLSDCPEMEYTCLILVTVNGRVEIIDKKLIYKSDICI
jgi:hypothetical protein